MAYWYNIATKQVETDENRSRNDDVMGPYDTEAEASNAIASAHAKTEQWDAEERAWEGEDSEA
ncbi:methionine aminopeptidase [Knoellia locipacati]|uniref:methionine aminopeptidase n=1 Tax=Knoellia locipacati TaxID=882824 RepID=UPI0011BEF700|nr:methionine aminopeptidase [Knoellia locipacati]